MPTDKHFKSIIFFQGFYSLRSRLLNIYCLLTAFTLFGYSPAYGQTPRNDKNKYLYSPEKSHYSIVFSSRPKIKTGATFHGEKLFKGEHAELYLSDGSFQRVEFYDLNDSLTNSIDEDYALYFLKKYCEINGLTNPSFQYNESGAEKLAELRGYKELATNSGSKLPVTYYVKVHIKATTFFVTYVGAASKDFPTYEITRFWNSIKVKDGSIGIALNGSVLDNSNGWSRENLDKLKSIFIVGINNGGLIAGKNNKEFVCNCAVEKTKSKMSFYDFMAKRDEAVQIIFETWKSCGGQISNK